MSDAGQIGLVGISVEASGRGRGRSLVERAMQFFSDSGVMKASLVTQGRNIAAQRVYQKAGFVMREVTLSGTTGGRRNDGSAGTGSMSGAL